MTALNMFSLAGRTALITGSSRGIGFALAQGLAEAGATIVLNGRDRTALSKAAQHLREAGATVHELLFDVTNPDDAAHAIDRFEDETGPVDILINNAGMQHRSPLEAFETEKFDALIRTNVNSVFYVGKAAAKHMIARGKGKIINICSINSLLARPTIAPYTASKGAVANLTKGMATDWAKHGLNINGLAPGYFKSELNAALVADPEFTRWLEKRTPMARWGDMSELVGAAIFLSSEASSFVNGHILYVDGAISATL